METGQIGWEGEKVKEKAFRRVRARIVKEGKALAFLLI
jgi:hypothetical protein